MKKILIISSILFLVGCRSEVFKSSISKIIGVNNAEIKQIQGIDEFAGFGEGYTFETFELSEKTIQMFINHSSKKLPDKEDKIAWQKQNWVKTPVDSSYSEILVMGLNYNNGNKGLENQLSEIKKVLEKEMVYYSLYYKPNKDNPRDFQLFILDVNAKKLYIIEVND